ncbi:MAG TPA: winged helix-turn-helix domain-containing protein [Methanocella sp.]|nr:winged helix-turn-helix domain-containing protein [Methanocella sp.]
MLKGWLGRLLRGEKTDDYERKLKRCLRDQRCGIVIRLVQENPGISAVALAKRSHLDLDAVAGYLNGLMANGLVVAESEDGRAGYHIADAAKAAVVKHLPLNYQCPGLLRE